MTRPLPTAVLVLGLAWIAAACGDHEYHPPSEEERAAQADAVYSPALFDSITWNSEADWIEAGNLVFATECRRCHGPLGRGDTEYARQNEIDVPSLVEPDWAYAGRLDSVRYQIFVGHGEMQSWGVIRLTPREIDAAAAYIVEQLRPEVLGEGAETPD